MIHILEFLNTPIQIDDDPCTPMSCRWVQLSTPLGLSSYIEDHKDVLPCSNGKNVEVIWGVFYLPRTIQVWLFPYKFFEPYRVNDTFLYLDNELNRLVPRLTYDDFTRFYFTGIIFSAFSSVAPAHRYLVHKCIDAFLEEHPTADTWNNYEFPAHITRILDEWARNYER